MIPKIIHQTWRDHILPVPSELPDSWKEINPDWDYRFWTDTDLLDFVSSFYPELLELYTSYPSPVQRADLARYLLLDQFGGIYADIDTRCVGPLDAIVNEDRIILSSEPDEHLYHVADLGLPWMLFNGVIASPQKHPFWQHVVQTMTLCATGVDHILESTGPLMLSGAAQSYPDREQLAIHSCHLFTPQGKSGVDDISPETGPLSPLRICEHIWQGSWYSVAGRKPLARLKLWWRKTLYYLTRGCITQHEQLAQSLDQNLLSQPLPEQDINDPSVAVLIPIRDAAPFLERCVELLRKLDYPKHKLRIIFCEGDSNDDTRGKIAELQERYGAGFAGMELLTYKSGYKIERRNRWKPRYQAKRRSNLARVRNHLVRHFQANNEEWALWIDADVCDYAPDTLRKLLDLRKKVIVPNCVLDWGGQSFDQNSFFESNSDRDARYYKHVHKGIFQPPANFHARRHLHDLRFLSKVPLDGIGGTMILVHGSVHRAGITFPEYPYKDLLETEGFGKICRDFGVRATGLPNLEIQHVKS